MDTSGLVSAVLHIVAQGAGGAMSAAGGSAAEALITALRERLGGTEEGRAALDAFVENPGDGANMAAVRAVLDREVAADPGFGQRLEALAGAAPVQSPQTTTTSVVIGDGAKVSRNQISLGPLTINNNRQGHWVLSVLIAALLIVAALASYGGVQIITEGDDGAAGSGASSQERSTPPVADPLPATRRTAESIAPSLAALEGTRFDDGGLHESWICGDYPNACGNRVRSGVLSDFIDYEKDFIAQFHVLVHASEDDAERTFDAMGVAFEYDPSESYGYMYDPSAYTPPEGVHSGDDFGSYRIVRSGEQGIGVLCVIQHGAYVGLIRLEYNYFETDGQDAVVDNDTQIQVSTLLLRRMSEAWSGETPDTTARDIQGA